MIFSAVTPHINGERGTIATFTRTNKFPMQISVDSLAAFCSRCDFKAFHHFYDFNATVYCLTTKRQPTKTNKRFVDSFSPFVACSSIVCNLIQISNIAKEIKCAFYFNCEFAHEMPVFVSLSLDGRLLRLWTDSHAFLLRLLRELVALSTRMKSSLSTYDGELVFSAVCEYFHLISYYFQRWFRARGAKVMTQCCRALLLAPNTKVMFFGIFCVRRAVHLCKSVCNLCDALKIWQWFAGSVIQCFICVRSTDSLCTTQQCEQ